LLVSGAAVTGWPTAHHSKDLPLLYSLPCFRLSAISQLSLEDDHFIYVVNN